jgi:hypothetical protein
MASIEPSTVLDVRRRATSIKSSTILNIRLSTAQTVALHSVGIKSSLWVLFMEIIPFKM